MKSVPNILGSIIVIAAIAIALYFHINDSELRNKATCEEYYEYLNLEFYTSLQGKFLDTNSHMRPTIKVNDIEIDVSLDNFGLYESILIGDSLVKVRSNPEIKVYRDSVLINTFKIDFGCLDD